MANWAYGVSKWRGSTITSSAREVLGYATTSASDASQRTASVCSGDMLWGLLVGIRTIRKEASPRRLKIRVSPTWSSLSSTKGFHPSVKAPLKSPAGAPTNEHFTGHLRPLSPRSSTMSCKLVQWHCTNSFEILCALYAHKGSIPWAKSPNDIRLRIEYDQFRVGRFERNDHVL